MRQLGKRTAAVLLTILLTLGGTASPAWGECVLTRGEEKNLSQMTVTTPQEDISTEMNLAETETEIWGEWIGRDDSMYSSPLDIAAAGGRIYTADYTAKCLRVLDARTDEQLADIPLEAAPNTVLASPDGESLYVGAGGAEGKIYVVDAATGGVSQTFEAGHTPSALELSAAGNTLYVANRFSGTLQVINLITGRTISEFPVTREPMALVRAGTKLFLASHLITGSAQQDVVASDVICIDLTAEEISAPVARKTIRLLNGSTNVKDMAVSPDGAYIYITHALGRYNVATTQADRGWIYNNALTELRVLDCQETAVMLLDDLDWGAGNPWGVAVTEDQIFTAIAGTRELIAIDRQKMREKIDAVSRGSYWNGKNQGLKYHGYLQNKDDISNDLTFLTEMKTRIRLGQDGPRGIAVSGGKVYTANYFSGSVTVVNAETYAKKTVSFSTAAEDDVRMGERLWNDATIGFQQWQSCASCHPDARVDGLNWDNLNDGIGTPKQARTMLDTFKRGRVMATGIRANAKVAVRAGLKYIMFNANYPEANLEKIDAYLRALQPEPSPYLVNGRLSESALRGKSLFEGEAGCAGCHVGEIKGQDKLIYNYTQTGNEARGLLVPPLVEAWRTAPYLCDGRAATVKEVLTTYNPGYGTGNGRHGNVNSLTDAQLNDLQNYVMSLSTELPALTCSATGMDFGILDPGYGPIEAKEVTIGGFEVGELEKASVKLENGTAFTITASAVIADNTLVVAAAPKAGLEAGLYTDSLLASVPGGASTAVTLRFVVGGELLITGPAIVGETLSIVKEGLNGNYSWQWYRGTVKETMTPIGSATKDTYLLSEADAGLRIGARAESPNAAPLESEATEPVKRLGEAVSLTIEGIVKAGEMLTARLTGTANRYEYTWSIDGAEVGSGRDYLIKEEDGGKRIMLNAYCSANGSHLSAGPVQVPRTDQILVVVLLKDTETAVVEGAEVVCRSGEEELRNRTDTAGKAVFALGAGSYEISAEKSGISISKGIEVTEQDISRGEKLAELTIGRAAEYTLSGSFRSAGEYGVLAELIDESGRIAAVVDGRRTEGDSFSLTAPAGTYTLKLRKPGHLSYTVTGVPLSADTQIGAALQLISGDARPDSRERIDFLDIAAMAGAFVNHFRLQDVPDIDGDGLFTTRDLAYVRENYGKTAVTISYSQLLEPVREGSK